MKAKCLFNKHSIDNSFKGILLLILLFGFIPVQAQWVLVSDNKTPESAMQAGSEADGTPLYIARIHYEGGIHIGKARANAKDAFIPYGGSELVISPYEIYIGKGRWVEVSGGRFPARAIAGGNENDGSALFIARAYMGGSWHIGKVRSNATEAFIPYGGREEIVTKFQVLSR